MKSALKRMVHRAQLVGRITLLEMKGNAINNEISRLWDTYDCGAALINEMTGGRLGRLEKALEVHRAEWRRLKDEYDAL